MNEEKGWVSLVGAGCGSRELISLKGLERLENCDAAVYDELIDDSLLDVLPEGCERIYMGKRSGKHSATQEKISETLVRLAQQGKRVVRLKGGDPFVFGRGGEEILALQRAGIAYELVPGISSAIAIPAAAGIPVTHRGLSRSFHVVTAHSAGNDGLPEELPWLAKLSGTLVFLMGLSKIKELAEALQREGKAPDTPAAVISGGNAPCPAAVRGSLSDIAELSRKADVKPPAVIVVGPTAAMHLMDGAVKRPLDGVRVGITGTDRMAEKLEKALRKEGAFTVRAERSVAELLPIKTDAEKLCDGRTHWLVFTSANGVQIFFEKLKAVKLDIRRLSSCRFAVIGASTGRALTERGIYPDICPETYTSEALGKHLAAAVKPGEGVFLLRAEEASSVLPDILRENNIEFNDTALYRLRADSSLTERCRDKLDSLDCLTFSSAGGLRLFLSEYGHIPENAVCVCIGQVTAAELSRVYSRPFLTAKTTDAEGIVRAIKEYMQK